MNAKLENTLKTLNITLHTEGYIVFNSGSETTNHSKYGEGQNRIVYREWYEYSSEKTGGKFVNLTLGGGQIAYSFDGLGGRALVWQGDVFAQLESLVFELSGKNMHDDLQELKKELSYVENSFNVSSLNIEKNDSVFGIAVTSNRNRFKILNNSDFNFDKCVVFVEKNQNADFICDNLNQLDREMSAKLKAIPNLEWEDGMFETVWGETFGKIEYKPIN